jgi:protein ImuB
VSWWFNKNRLMYACIHCREGSRQALLNLAFTFSPRVEDTAPDAVVLDIDGLERMFGSPLALAERIVRLASDAGLRVEVGVASNPDAAVCAARGLGGIAVIPAGQEALLLAALPVSLLFSSAGGRRPAADEASNLQLPAADSRQSRYLQNPIHANRAASVSERAPREANAALRQHPLADARGSVAASYGRILQVPQSPEIEETLRLWGIRTLGELAALPEAALSARIGQEGPRLQKLARGAGCRPLLAFSPVPSFEHSLELEYPVALLEPLFFVLSRLLHELWAGLEARALATDELRLRLHLEDRSADKRNFRLPFPLRDHRAGLKLMQLELEQRPPQAAVTAVWLAANPVEPRVLQDGLFIPLAPAPDKLEVMLARIANLVGQQNVGSAELLDTHRRGAFRVKRFTIRPPGSNPQIPQISQIPNLRQSVKSADSTLLAFRVFRPPLPAQVQARQGRPERITARGVKGNVVSLAGAWRTSGDWWKSDGWDRDEWDVALSDGALYRIYCDRATRAWFIEGLYD